MDRESSQRRWIRAVGRAFTRLPGRLSAFVKRQFDARPTWRQKTFDLVVCVVLVPLFLVYDQGLFTSYELGVGGEFQILAYCMVGMEIVVLCLWLGLGKHARFASGVLGGMFLVGGILVIPLLFYLTAVYPVYLITAAEMFVILPMLLFEALTGVGPGAEHGVLEALGFACFAVGYVFLPPALIVICFRNAVRALRTACRYYEIGSHVTMTCILGVFLALAAVLPPQVYVSLTISKCVRQLRDDNPQVGETIQRLKTIRWCRPAHFDRLVIVYFMGSGIVEDVGFKNRLALAYTELTGWSIQERWADIGN